METTIRKNNQYEILTPEGWKDFDGIRRSKSNHLIKIQEDNKELLCTPNHQVWANNQLIESIWLGETVSISSEGVYVYDPLEVKSTNHLYLSNGFISKNCEFMGSSGTLIAGWKLKELMPRATISPIREGMYKYEDPIPGHSYAITADVSEGKKLNYSAFHVTDISQMPYRQVCVYRNNTVTPGDFAEVLVLSAEAYNHACILIEYMAMGTLVSKEIWDGMEYDNILFTKSMGRSGRQVTQRIDDGADLGLKMTEVTKKQGCLWLKLLIEQDQYLLNNKDTIDELARFSKHNNSFKAEEGATDDLVMSLVVFAWLTNQDYFRDLTNINTMEGLREKKKEEVEDDLTPLGLMMWRAADEGLMPSTAELHGRNTGDNLIWSPEQRRNKDYSPYVSNDDWHGMYDNPYEKQDDDRDDEHYIPIF